MINGEILLLPKQELGYYNNIKNMNKKIFGLSIIEALVATVIVGIGFVAVLQMTSFAVTSIDTSGERTKANYLVNMIAEGFIGYKDTIGGITQEEQKQVTYQGGKAYLEENECKKFAEYYKDLGTADSTTCGARDSGLAKIEVNKVVLEAELFSLDGKQRFYLKSSKDLNLAAELGKEVGEILKKKSKDSYKK